MKRFLLSLAASLAFALSLGATTIHKIDVKLDLCPDGTALVTEIWDINVDEGTEWYLVKYNLGAMKIRDLSVSDETGLVYYNEGSWDVDRSFSRKAGRCGLVRKNGGVEICWGLGSYGNHIYTVRYTMSGAVENLNDYDMLHLQLVSPGLSARPEQVRVKISAQGLPLDTSNTRLWGFGFAGEAVLEGGEAVYRSTERFQYNSSVIALLRFNKGFFYSDNVVSKNFEEVLSRALEGSSYSTGEDEVDDWVIFLTMILSIGLAIGVLILVARAYKRTILGVPTEKEIDWCREVPYGGEIIEADYVYHKLHAASSQASIAGAMILRMVQKGLLTVSRDAKDRIEIHFAQNPSFEGLQPSYAELFMMLREAAGSDVILQDHEFSRWSKRHDKRVDKWCRSVTSDAKSSLNSKRLVSFSDRFSEEGKAEARKLVGFRKFLKDFTLVDERRTSEVGLWNDYLVYGMLFGIADKIAKELADIDPKMLADTVYSDPWMMYHIIHMSNRMALNVTNASAQAQARAASHGLGGATSFGGGGGFHGGGFGGGAR